METRQQDILFQVIENYIKSAEPVGSKFLVREEAVEWSEATVRNVLRELEEAGYLTHPHTSAGRIPTTLGYRYYLQNTDVATAHPTKSEITQLERAAHGAEVVARVKALARTMVDLSSETMLVAFSKDSIYYTGLTNLFQKPDFKELGLVASLTQVFDRCEEFLPGFYRSVGTEPRYYLGNEHPFGEMMSALSVRFGDDGQSLMVLLGPQRMDYKHNWGLFTKAVQLL